MWANRAPFEPTMLERLDEMFASGDCPPALVVFVDAWTSYGGSQFLNSSQHRALHGLPVRRGRPVRRRALPDPAGPRAPRAERQVLRRLRRDGRADAAARRLRRARLARRRRAVRVLLPAELPALARMLRDEFDGSLDVFWEQLRARPSTLDMERFENFDLYGYAAAYSPDPERPGKALLPFELATGRLIDDVWAQWLEWDPVRMAPRHADALRSMRRVYLDAGKERRVVPRPRRAGLRGRARQARRRAHARAVQRQARRA